MWENEKMRFSSFAPPHQIGTNDAWHYFINSGGYCVTLCPLSWNLSTSLILDCMGFCRGFCPCGRDAMEEGAEVGGRAAVAGKIYLCERMLCSL